MIIEPNGYLLLCANGEILGQWWCRLSWCILYQTFGGGFGLSNTEDEVILRSIDNVMLDRFDYSEDSLLKGSVWGWM